MDVLEKMENILKHKKAQQLSVTSIILIVLGVLILIVLILGFTIGWEKLMPWLKPSNNIKEIVSQCSIACSTEIEYDFCSIQRTVKVAKENAIDGMTEFSATCEELATDEKYSILGIDECSGLCETAIESEAIKTCTGSGLALRNNCLEGEEDVSAQVTDIGIKTEMQAGNLKCCKK